MTQAHDPSDILIDTASQVHRSSLRLVRLLRDARSGQSLGTAKLGVLGRLHRHGGATATALAAYLRVQPQSLTRLLADLEQSGLITRRTNAADRRQSLLEITETGTQLLVEEVGGQRLQLAQIIAQELTSTEQELLRLAAGLLDRLAAAAEAAPARPVRSGNQEEDLS
jgi:DNA-binding MarR family transcriptional regulator